MPQAKSQFATFEEYLTYDDGTDTRYELVDEELVELPPESRPNLLIANFLFLFLVNAGVPLNLVYTHACEIQVPVLQVGDAKNRYPDLVILREEHLALTQQRATITLQMSPPVLIAEVVSPGDANRVRDYERKREQYCQIGVQEYWLLDPELQIVIVLTLKSGKYLEVGQFRGHNLIQSQLEMLQGLQLTSEQIFGAGH